MLIPKEATVIVPIWALNNTLYDDPDTCTYLPFVPSEQGPPIPSTHARTLKHMGLIR